MKRILRFFSNVLSRTNTEKTMSRIRYFINTAVDVPPGEVQPIPAVTLRPVLNEILTKITGKFKPVPKNGEDGLYLGTAGVAYMYYHLSKIEELKEYQETFIKQAVDYIQPALLVCSKASIQKQDVPSFLLGNGGVYAVAAAIYQAANEYIESAKYRNLYIEAGNICKELQFLSCGSDELFVGRTGYLCGALWLQKELNMKFDMHEIYELCHLTIESGRQYAFRYNSPCPLMYSYYNVEYLGAGHGLSSILLYILCVPGYVDANPKDAKTIKSSVDYLLSLQDEEGNFPTSMDEIGTEVNDLIHWCHGAGGVVYLFAKAYLTWNEEKYLNSIKRSGELIWEKGLLKKGPGLCHGVAGNGYVFLLLYRLTNDINYLHRANTFSNFMHTDEFQKKARIPDNPYSLYEGLAGTACFVGDLLKPEKAVFPFTDIF